MRLALLIWLCLAGQAPTAYDLVWKPKAGQSYRYDLAIDLVTDGTRVGYRAELAVSVPKVDPDGGYTVSTSTSSQKVTADGKTTDMSENAKPREERFNARGESLEKDGPPQEALSRALDDLTDFAAPAKPVKIGDKWSRIIPGDAKQGLSPVRIEYTLAGSDKVGKTDTLKLILTYV
ncbi:MAG TPA: hypothetical protein VG820_03005, partial [Fimbriimonadaceae bacterium]|nr:hypothetical protein [Fimbriimonadaceae bacterium]